MNGLIRVSGDRLDAFATLAAAARVYTITHDQKHEQDAAEEDVWPITRDGTFNVLFPLARR